jgi:Iap family predicted aminopeptidase
MKSLLILLVFLSPAPAFSETVEFKVLSEGVLENRLRLAHRKMAERYQRLRTLFEETGCTDLREQKVSRSKEPNLICAVDGGEPARGRIVVGAHFDHAGGDGIIDNWTGAILLPSLAAFMREKPRRHSFHFVGFAAEEKGLLGSAAYLKSMTPEERKQIAAVVTMDSLGLTPTKCWPNSSSKELMGMAAQLAYALKTDFGGVNLDAVGNTDSMTFHKAGMPVLSLHSLTTETWKLINSPRDVWKSLSWKDYYESHRFISALLVYLDQRLP